MPTGARQSLEHIRAAWSAGIYYALSLRANLLNLAFVGFCVISLQYEGNTAPRNPKERLPEHMIPHFQPESLAHYDKMHIAPEKVLLTV
jgi:hypothetical protein